MRDATLAPYLFWAKSREPAAMDLAGSNLLPCTIDDLPGAREALDISAANDNGYAPLVDAIAAHYRVPPERVALGTGCSGANFLAIAATVGAGDHVLIERPTYDPLIGACRLMGADVAPFDRRFDAGYAIDLDDLRRRITHRTKLIVLTNPHNPSGVLLDREAIARVAAMAADAGLQVLVDEVYLDAASLVRGEAPGARSAAGLDAPILVTNSLTKSYGLAGLRCGWVIAPPAVAERVRRTRDVVDNAGSAPADRLGAFAYSMRARLAERARLLLVANIEHAARFFSGERALELAAPPSSSIVFPRLRGHADAAPFVRFLLDRGVAVAPGAFFDAPAQFRVSLAGSSDRLALGLTALGDALREFEGRA